MLGKLVHPFCILLVLFSLLFGAIGVMPAQAQGIRTSSELSADDWMQINALLPESAGPNFEQERLHVPTLQSGDQFGKAVAVSGNTVVVGTPFDNGGVRGINGDPSNKSQLNSGAVFVFVRNGTTWSQQAYIKSSNADGGSLANGDGDFFGISVAISGNTLVVGATGEDSSAIGVNGNQTNNTAFNSGAVYVFTRVNGVWSQQAYIKASNTGGSTSSTDPGDSFGASVAILGDLLAVGAPNEDSNAITVNGDQVNNSLKDSGAVYTFGRTGTQWSQQAYLKAPASGANAHFGASLAMSDETVLIGSKPDESNISGAVYAFVRSGADWSLQASILGTDTTQFDGFGFSLAALGDTLVIGAPRKLNASSVRSGAAYIFTRSGADWSQQAYLEASNADRSDQFGAAVSISGDIVVVGAPNESSNAEGVNGIQNNDSSPNSGAAYVFARSENEWSQTNYLKSSANLMGAHFGTSLAISDGTLVVGEPDQGMNGTISSGAAYVYAEDYAVPTVVDFVTASTSNSLKIPISVFKVSDNMGVKRYLITTSPTPPTIGTSGWNTNPKIYYVPADGTYTLYPWAKDGANNISPLFGSPSPVVVDAPPKVTSIMRAGPILSNSAIVKFIVKFIEPVTGVDTADFGLYTSGLVNPSIFAVSGSGNTYTVTVKVGSRDGTVRLDLIDNDTIKDASGYPLGGGVNENGTYKIGQSYKIDIVPATVFPSGTVTTPTPTYQWTVIPTATKYQYELFQGTKLIYSKVVYPNDVCHVNSDCYSPALQKIGNGIYKWHVRAMVNGGWRDYSAYRTFSVVLPPEVGFWSGSGTEFFVTGDHNTVNNFAIYVNIPACGLTSLKLVSQTAVPIVNNKASQTGQLYFDLSFVWNKSTGTVGLQSYLIPGCGYVTGGPYTTNAVWKNGSQPATLNSDEIMPIIVVPSIDDFSVFYDIENVTQ